MKEELLRYAATGLQRNGRKGVLLFPLRIISRPWLCTPFKIYELSDFGPINNK